MVMCFDFYPEAGGWLLSEFLLLLVHTKQKWHAISNITRESD